jgi:hypothetical protein
MPTEVTAELARKRMAEVQTQGDMTVMLICLIFCLLNIMLLHFDEALVKATILSGLY